MPLPKRREDESRENFMSRCMSNKDSKKEFPDNKQRVAVCLTKATEGMSSMAAADLNYNVEEFGYTEELTEENFYIPTEAEYDAVEGESTQDWDISVARPGLWENIRRKKEREGKNYRPARTEKEGRPTQEQLKRAQSKDMSYCKCGTPEQVGGFTCDQHCDYGDAEAYADHLDETEALQYGRPKKNDPRKTPAPKKDQKRGSKRNKPDSAKSPKGKITFSKKTTERLSKIVREHNAKGKGSKATLGALKAVYRRGAGAFSTSHAPKMSRDGWAMARVRAFLYLLRNGRPSNPNYKQDNDLLPKGHPRKSKAEMSPKQREALDKNKDGKISKEDFELLRKDKKKGDAAEYQGRKVTLNKPFRTPDGPKKFSVYVKNEKGNVVKVNFGDPNMEIKRDDPARRKSFRARHKCDTNPGPKWKARYWSCKKW